MAAPIQTERLLLEVELLGFRPRCRLRQRRRFRARARLVSAASEPAEQLRLPLVPVALTPRAVLAGRVDRGEEPRPERRATAAARGVGRASESNAPAFDEALEHALVDQAQIEILAERVQRRDAPVSSAGPRGATAIAPSPTFLIAVSPKRTPSGVDGERAAGSR